MKAPIAPEAHIAALASLRDMGPRRLRALLGAWGPAEAWCHVVAGDRRVAEVLSDAVREPAIVERWRREAGGVGGADLWRAHADAGVGVRGLGPGLPAALRNDPDPPAAVFHSGDLALLDGPRVAVVGTRRATRYGHDIAVAFGRDLARAGVSVVSGLALGIDGAAHRGALDAHDGAPPVGVVATGLDVVYPRAHRTLWDAVADRGLLISEAPLGVGPARWRFPARNRLIAALADVAVIVESRATGGSLITANLAADRGRPVLAVPGSIHSAASEGTNALLCDIAIPVTSIDDVLLALGMTPGRARARPDLRPAPDRAGAQVLDAIGWRPRCLEEITAATGLALDDVVTGLSALEADGWVADSGGWYERVAGPL